MGRDRPFDLTDERRGLLRRLTVRRRRERSDPDRRVSERRRPASRLGLEPAWAFSLSPA